MTTGSNDSAAGDALAETDAGKRSFQRVRAAMSRHSGAIRLALAAILLAILIQADVIRWEDLAVALSDPLTIGLSVVAVSLSNGMAILRWALLLRTQGIGVTFGQAFCISYVALFLATFLPGAASGDAAKLGYLFRQVASHRMRAAAITIVDRVIGLFVLMLLSCAGLNFIILHYGGDPALVPLAVVVGAVCLGLFFAIAAARPVRWFVGGMPLRIRKSRPFQIFLSILDGVAGHRWQILLQAVFLSALGHAFFAGAVIIVAQSTIPDELSSLQYGVAALIASAANAAPVTPGGIGVGEAAFAQICRAMADPTSVAGFAAAFLAVRIAMFIAALPGLAVFVAYRGQRGAIAVAADTTRR